MTDIEIFLKHIKLTDLAYEPSLSEEFIEKYILPNHLQYDIDHRIGPCYCLGQFIARQTFSEEFIEKHIEDFLPGMSSIFRHQQISFAFIKKYYKNNQLEYLLKNNKINIPIDFIIEKIHNNGDRYKIFTLILKKYDMPKEFLLKYINDINDLIYECEYNYNQDDYDYENAIDITEHNAKIINHYNDKKQIFS